MTRYPLAIVMPNLRSSQNVGSVLRTADAAGVRLVITCGYTPHPVTPNDTRPAHVITSNTNSIAKTALGAERTVPLLHFETLGGAINHLKQNEYTIAALEQAEGSTNLLDYQADGPLALILGNEVEGLDEATLKICDVVLELPMIGSKESLNVAIAAGIAIYRLTFA